MLCILVLTLCRFYLFVWVSGAACCGSRIELRASHSSVVLVASPSVSFLCVNRSCYNCSVNHLPFLMLVVLCSGSLLFSIILLQFLACVLMWFAFYDLIRYWCGSFSSGHQTRRALSAKCLVGPYPIRIWLWWFESSKLQICIFPGFHI